MKKRLMNNLFLKIISVLIAILVWLVIANANDPIVTKTYNNVPVAIQNSAYIESIMKTYRVEEQQQTVTVMLKGRSSVVEGRANDIQAVADLTQIVDMETKPYVMVPITVTCDQVSPENITVLPRNMAIVVEESETKEFAIGYNIDNTIPDKDYRIGNVEVKPEKVQIKGPASLVQKIDHVTTNVDVAGLTEDTMKTGRLRVYDKNQDELSAVNMSYLKFDIDNATVDVNIKLWKVRPDVTLKVAHSGAPADGYQVSEVVSTPSKISVAGTDEALAKLEADGNVIEIPEDQVVIDGQKEDFEVKVELSKCLPEDIILATEEKAAIVHVSIMPIGSKQFTISTQNIKVNNPSDKYKLVYNQDKITVRVKGETEPLTRVNENTVKPVIDLTGMEKGDYTIPVELTLPEGCELLEPVTVSAQLTELE